MKKHTLFVLVTATMLALVPVSFGQGAILIQSPPEDLLHPRLPSPLPTPSPISGVSPILLPSYPSGAYEASPVPEPGVFGLFALGGAMIVSWRKIKK